MGKAFVRKTDRPEITECVIYLRISLDKSGQQLGVDRQEPPCRDLALRLGLTVRQVYTDNDLSATTGVRRPGFEQLLTDVAAKPAIIICWHNDRFLRLSSELERVIKLDVDIHAVVAGTFDLSTASGRAHARVMTAIAQMEGELKAERQRAAALQRAEAGRHWWVRRPFGLNLDGTLREDEADAARRTYRDFLNGVPVAQLAKDLNAVGFKTSRGTDWTQPSLRQYLISPRNAGIREYRREEVGPGLWEAIIPVETYRAVMDMFAARKGLYGPGGARQYLLSGLALCGVCRSLVKVAVVYGRNGTSYRTYTCRKGSCMSHRTDLTDRIVGGFVMEFLSTTDGRRVWAGSDVTAEDLEAMRAKRDAYKVKESEISEMFTEGEITRAQMSAMNSKLMPKLAAIEAKLAETGSKAIEGYPQATPDEVIRDWNGYDMERQRACLEALRIEVVLMPKGRGVRKIHPDQINVSFPSPPA